MVGRIVGERYIFRKKKDLDGDVVNRICKLKGRTPSVLLATMHEGVCVAEITLNPLFR